MTDDIFPIPAPPRNIHRELIERQKSALRLAKDKLEDYADDLIPGHIEREVRAVIATVEEALKDG